MRTLIGLTLVGAFSAAASAREPILDMHLHARTAHYAGQNPPPMCAPFEILPRSAPGKAPTDLDFNRALCESPVPLSPTDAAVLAGTLEAMEKYNIIGVVSGEPELIARWRAAAPRRIIPAFDFRLPGTSGARHVKSRTVEQLREHHRAGAFAVLGEMMAQYEGVAANDPRLEPYWRLAEELDFPVAIHMGPGEPGQPYYGAYRAALGNPSCSRRCWFVTRG